MRLQNEVAIVTGGARNIGQSICEVFAQEGAKVVIGDIDVDRANKVVADLNEKGAEAIAVATDVSQETDIKRLVETAIDKWGRLDIVVNNVAATDQKTYSTSIRRHGTR